MKKNNDIEVLKWKAYITFFICITIVACALLKYHPLENLISLKIENVANEWFHRSELEIKNPLR